MIRLSHESDRKGIINLWKEAFGDTEEAINLFLDDRYIPQNTVVCEDNGIISSMLFLLEGKLIIDHKEYDAYYLYAAATLKEFRGRGVMAQLLEYSKNTAAGRNIDFICLKPAEESLFDYYSKHGYRKAFSLKSIEINIRDIKDLKTIKAAEKYDRFIWDKSAVEYAKKQHLFYGGKVFDSCEGKLLYSINNYSCVVKGYDFTNRTISDFTNLDFGKEFDNINIEVPYSFNTASIPFKKVDSGMALAVSDRAKNFISLLNNAFLSLTLD